MLELDKLRAKLTTEEPADGGIKTASVAVILDGPTTPSILLIRRAQREGDPWSGQVAFPGGKRHEADRSLKETALRETREEVGFDIEGRGEFLGYYIAFRTHTGTMNVVPAVFMLDGRPKVRLNQEASDYRWVPMSVLGTRETESSYKLGFPVAQRTLPAFKIDGFIVWGLTHRILSTLLELSPPSG